MGLINPITITIANKIQGKLNIPPSIAISFLTGLSAYQEARTKKKKVKDLNNGRNSSFFKEGKKLSEAMEIMDLMKNNHEIDKDLFDIFIKKRVYQEYADKYLCDDQIDDIDEASLIG